MRRHKRVSLKPILSLPMKVPVAVICSNVNMWHDTVFIRYAFWDRGFIYDEPSFDEIIEISREIKIPFTRWKFIESMCHSCRTGVPL
jgi:hypothetical protein